MVEVYYQVQSYNGTLTDGMLLMPQYILAEMLIMWQNMVFDSGAHECSKAWKASRISGCLFTWPMQCVTPVSWISIIE